MNTRRVGLGSALVVGALVLLPACGGSTSNGTTSNGTTGATGAATSSTFKVQGTDALKFDPTSGSVAAGTVTITLTAGKAVNHDIVIEKLGDKPVVEAAPGKTASAKVTLAAGTYVFYCNVPGHRGAGMEGTLTVS